MSHRRWLRSLMLAATVGALGAAPAAASTDLGQFCFVFSGFTDTIRLAATQPSGGDALAELHFRWSGLNYQMLGSGTAASNVADPSNKIDIALVGAHNSTEFGGHKLCSLYFTLTLATGTGPFTVTCAGAAGPPFTTSGVIQATACAGP